MQVCRLLARFKTNFQLSELVKVDGYADCVALLAAFTVHSLQHWQWSANSLHFLLLMWERLVVSLPYVTCEKPHLIDKFTPQITEAYIQVGVGPPVADVSPHASHVPTRFRGPLGRSVARGMHGGGGARGHREPA